MLLRFSHRKSPLFLTVSFSLPLLFLFPYSGTVNIHKPSCNFSPCSRSFNLLGGVYDSLKSNLSPRKLPLYYGNFQETRKGESGKLLLHGSLDESSSKTQFGNLRDSIDVLVVKFEYQNIRYKAELFEGRPPTNSIHTSKH